MDIINRKAVKEFLKLLPAKISHFRGSQYPLPIKTAFLGLGDDKLSISELRQTLSKKQDKDIKYLLEPFLLAAELYEASQKDNKKYFITDKEVQSYVFMGSKWKAGWVLVLGGKNQSRLIDNLKNNNFIVFTDLPNIPDTVYIGNRLTSPVYFLQLMVRYGLIWGNIKPGDDHQMGHFLEKDMPGFIIIFKNLSPLKYLITLGLMKLGAPAVVPSTFPFPYGNRIVADNINDIIKKGSRFPNLRQQYYKDEVINLPEYCNPAFANEKIKVGKLLGGKSDSFFCLMPSSTPDKHFKITGRKPDDNISILIKINDKKLTDDIAKTIEKTALRSLNFLQGIKAYIKEEKFILEIGKNNPINEKKIYETIYWGIRLQYPRLKKISVNIIYDPKLLKKESIKIKKYKKQQKKFIQNMNEKNTEDFCFCTDCRPFSLVHTCILTPDRIPMCASRTYFTIKAESCFGMPFVPFQRKSEKNLPLRAIFKKGRIINKIKGEYEGCNKIYRETTGGKLKRVFLHSLREYPPTSCGCFQALAFRIKEAKGIGIMIRDSKAVAPDGRTWEILANQAGGKQTPGILGISINYIHSPNFLKGDGGISKVVWVDSELYKRISKYFLKNQKIATEKNVTFIEDLKKFLK